MTPTTQAPHDRPVGEIAARLPGASGVFRQYGIDFCCHGDVPLQQAATSRGLDPRVVLEALNALDPAAAPLAPEETGALIDHIQTRYHDVHRRQIPELIELSSKVELVHLTHPDVPTGLADALERILGELEVHMKKEELILFPAMRRQAAARLATPIGVMRHNHDSHGRFLEEMARLTDDCVPPQGACRSWQALYAGAAQLRADLMEHIHLENNVLFPRFEAA
ncbi:MAG: iron-sulfur cluster repair protein YtfE [Geminicoccaceae bacterium]|nr:iron-sulfur cluster repair protein YtfE [Geminicoccaceae bacterium]MCB9969218.1 iron-sulfur cluster repair protein YtfE [Geminicoccaceae bacterium]